MDSVLLSIHPRFVNKIIDGEKTVEIRKSKPNIDVPFKCYIYMTSGGYQYQRSCWSTAVMPPNGEMYNGAQSIVGEFICNNIDRLTLQHFTVFGHENIYAPVQNKENIDFQWLKHSCLDYSEVVTYGKLAPLYVWSISNLVIYNQPKMLQNFRKKFLCNGKCIDCLQLVFHDDMSADCALGGFEAEKWYLLNRPPRSWCYVQECK